MPNVDVSASAPISHAGGRLVWTDIDPRAYTLDATGLEARVTQRTRAIVAVHMYGNPADMVAIEEIARRHGLPVVEDAALAPGATYRGKRVGSPGQVACTHLASEGIETGLHFVPPLHFQPAYRHLGLGRGTFPHTEQVADELLCLPTIPELTADEIERVGAGIRRFFQR